MATLSTAILSSWSDLRSATPTEADQAFVDALRTAGGGPAYMEFGADGGVVVRRDLEQAERAALETLHVVAWDPAKGWLLDVDFPYWFVRMKMSKTFNLGTLMALLARDWQGLDLEVSEENLEQRGPGLVLDHTLPDGRRVLLWTE